MSSASRRELVIARVAEADPGLSPEAVVAAVDAVAANARALQVLAGALAPGPEALHGGAPPIIGKLVGELRARGSTLYQPACARCGRSVPKLTASAEGGVCPRCRSHQTATACTICGNVRDVRGRDASGGALCAACAPRPKRPCSRCQKVRFIARRARDGEGDICDSCYKGPLATCGVCGQHRPCNFARTGQPICMSCSPRSTSRCAHCGEDRPATARWAEGPVCEPCYRAALSRRGNCSTCGEERRLVSPPGKSARLCADCAGVPPLAACAICGIEERPYRDGNCVRCALQLRTKEILGDTAGPLGALYDAIVSAPQPYSAHNWLRSSAAASILAEIASGSLPLSHEALDSHTHRRGADFLRQLLVSNGVLSARDDALSRLEAWVDERVREVDDPARRRLLGSYARWKVLRSARQRSEHSRTGRMATRYAKSRLLAAISFLDFLASRGRDLSSCVQADIDAWLASGPPRASDVNEFLDWAAARKLCGRFTCPGRARQGGPCLDSDTRWAIARRLLHDESIDLGDRVAGSLVLLYAQQLSRIVALRRDQLLIDGELTRLQIGSTGIDIPAPLDDLLRRLVAERRRYTGVGSPAISKWLFPGLDPGRPLGANRLGQRLRSLGLEPAPGRRAALSHLAANLPAAMLARLLGISPATAVRWVGAVGGDWTSYAAQLVREQAIAKCAE